MVYPIPALLAHHPQLLYVQGGDAHDRQLWTKGHRRRCPTL